MNQASPRNRRPSIEQFLGVGFAFLLISWGASFRLAVAPAPPFPRLATMLSHTLVYPSELISRSAFHLLRSGDVQDAKSLLQEALRRDPASAYRWCDLGSALSRCGLAEGATYSFHRAVELGPQSPGVLVRAATGMLALARPQEALPYGSAALALTDRYDSEVFWVYRAADLPIADVFAKGIPGRRAAVALFRYMIDNHADPGDLAQAWSYMAAHSLADDASADAYVNNLVDRGRTESAVAVWKAQLGSRSGDYPVPNRVANGDFEVPFTGGTLDWQVLDEPGVHVIRDLQAAAHSGRASLRIDFDGTANLFYEHVRQTVLLTPGWYRLIGWVRPRALTTDQGLGFWIHARQGASALDVRTSEVHGTAPWTRLETTFQVPAGISPVTVSVLRNNSLKFDHDISGTVWVDSVSLEPIGP